MPLYITVLYAISVLLVLGTGIHIVLQPKSTKANLYFFLFCCSGIAWMIFLYLTFAWSQIGQEFLALISTRLIFGFSLFSLYFLLKFVYLFPEKTFSVSKRTEYIFFFFIAFIAAFSSFTSYVYEDLIYVDTLLIKDKLGPLHFIFALVFLGCFAATHWLSISKIRTLKGIHKQKMFLVELGIVLGIVPVILSHMVLPLLDIYFFQIEIPASTLALFTIALYALQKYRFHDLRLTLSKTIKVLIAAACSAFTSYGLFFILGILTFPDWVGYIAAFITSLFSYSSIFDFLNSTAFYRFIGMTSGEYFVQTLDIFKKSKKNYKNFQDLRKSLRKMFCKSLKICSVELVLLKKNNKRKYLPLIQYFEQHHAILISKEVPFLQNQKNLTAIQKLTLEAEIYLPLFHVHSRNLLGFLILGKKPFDDLYSKQEIEAIERLQCYLSMQLDVLLYQSDLEKEIKAKTQALVEKHKIEQEVGLTLAHELKTPLAIATNNVYLLRDFLKESQEHMTSQVFQQLKNLTQNTDQSLKNMKHICENLLLLRELEMTQDIPKHTFNPAFQFEGVLAHYRHLSLEKGLKFKSYIEITQEIYGAGVYLEQVLTILLDNALKYTQQGSIEVVVEQVGKNLRLMVMDTGIGIAKEKRRAIFERFYRDRNEQNKNLSGVAGLGLGLFIASKILHHMKGSIRVEGNPQGQGSCFFVETGVEMAEKMGRT